MKFTATFILILMVSIQTPLGQLFKLPLLVEHFQKHQRQEGISLFHFLEEHYVSDHQDSDLPEDEQLPFKNVTFISIGHALVARINQSVHLTTAAAVSKVMIPEFFVAQQHLVSIFHPPRV